MNNHLRTQVLTYHHRCRVFARPEETFQWEHCHEESHHRYRTQYQTMACNTPIKEISAGEAKIRKEKGLERTSRVGVDAESRSAEGAAAAKGI